MVYSKYVVYLYNILKQIEIMKAFTEERVEVSERIKDGRTTFVETRKEAEKLTEKLGYFYPLFSTNCSKRELIGYGIPK